MKTIASLILSAFTLSAFGVTALTTTDVAPGNSYVDPALAQSTDAPSFFNAFGLGSVVDTNGAGTAAALLVSNNIAASGTAANALHANAAGSAALSTNAINATNDANGHSITATYQTNGQPVTLGQLPSIPASLMTNLAVTVNGIMATGTVANAATVTGSQSNLIATALQPSATNGLETAAHAAATYYPTSNPSGFISSAPAYAFANTNLSAGIVITNGTQVFVGTNLPSSGGGVTTNYGVTNGVVLPVEAQLPSLNAYFTADELNYMTNGQAVSLIPDLSTNGKSFNCSGCTYDEKWNLHASVYFSGSALASNLNYFATPMQTNFTMFLVVRYTSATPVPSSMFGSGKFVFLTSGVSYLSSSTSMGQLNQKGAKWDLWEPAAGVLQVMAFSYDGTTLKTWMNGYPSLETSATITPPFGWSTNLAFGIVDGLGGGYNWVGYLSECSTFNTNLPAAQFNALYQYYLNKYGKTDPAIVLNGDSTTTGNNVSTQNGGPMQVLNYPGFEPVGIAGGGQNMTVFLNYQTNTAWTKFKRGGRSIAILLDALFNGADSASLAETETNVLKWVANVRAYGWLPMVCTPFSNVIADTNAACLRSSFNSWLQTQTGSFAVVDSSMNPNYGQNFCYTNTTWFPDGAVHESYMLFTNWVSLYLKPSIERALAVYPGSPAASYAVNSGRTNLTAATSFTTPNFQTGFVDTNYVAWLQNGVAVTTTKTTTNCTFNMTALTGNVDWSCTHP